MVQALKALLLCALLLVTAGVVNAYKVGGKVAPDGAEIQIDLPEDLHRRNTSSPPGRRDSEGCCVFTSIHHAALWQNIPQLQEMPKWLQKKGMYGGGMPSNVDSRIKLYCQEQGQPIPNYIQVTGRADDVIPVIQAACASGRMAINAYARSPDRARYGGRISHMVNTVHASADGKTFGVLDNNFTGVAKYEWMTEAEYRRTEPVWAVVLIGPGPPPLPWN